MQICFFFQNGDLKYSQVAITPRTRPLWRLTLPHLKGVPNFLRQNDCKGCSLDYVDGLVTFFFGFGVAGKSISRHPPPLLRRGLTYQGRSVLAACFLCVFQNIKVGVRLKRCTTRSRIFNSKPLFCEFSNREPYCFLLPRTLPCGTMCKSQTHFYCIFQAVGRILTKTSKLCQNPPLIVIVYSFIIFTQGCMNQLFAVLTQGPALKTYYKLIKTKKILNR